MAEECNSKTRLFLQVIAYLRAVALELSSPLPGAQLNVQKIPLDPKEAHRHMVTSVVLRVLLSLALVVKLVPQLGQQLLHHA